MACVIGHIPAGFRSYFLTRSQPPFFVQMVSDYGRAIGDRTGALARYLPQIEAEYACFTTPERTHDGLTRNWNAAAGPRTEMLGTDRSMTGAEAARPGFYRDLRAACESGWDFSARWLTNPSDLATIRTTHILPVDLNSPMLGIEDILAEAAPAPALESTMQPPKRDGRRSNSGSSTPSAAISLICSSMTTPSSRSPQRRGSSRCGGAPRTRTTPRPWLLGRNATSSRPAGF